MQDDVSGIKSAATDKDSGGTKSAGECKIMVVGNNSAATGKIIGGIKNAGMCTKLKDRE